MYCVKCGVKLADSEKTCPLCGTRVFHPDLVQAAGEELFPQGKYPKNRRKPVFPQVFLTVLFLIPALIVLICDLQFEPGVTWAGYVIGALAVGYVGVILPRWWRNPNPVIFVPCTFLAVGLYLLFINLVTGGDWFLSFAFPVTGGVGVIVTTVVTLLRYLRGGKLFILGGAILAIGGWMLLVEYFMTITFPGVSFIGWSFYPMIPLVLLGGYLIFLGICTPARETMERKFFI